MYTHPPGRQPCLFCSLAHGPRERVLSCVCFCVLMNGLLFCCGTPKSTSCAWGWSSSTCWFCCSYPDSNAAWGMVAGESCGSCCRLGVSSFVHRGTEQGGTGPKDHGRALLNPSSRGAPFTCAAHCWCPDK